MRRYLIAALLVVGTAFPASAQENGGCNQFAWPITQEQNLFKQSDLPHVRSGSVLGAKQQADVLDLKPIEDVQWTREPERAAKSANSYGGVFIANLPETGLYQISLSGEAWIDAIQNDSFVKSAAHSGKRDCADIRKSVRFSLSKGALIVQISGAQNDSIKFLILPVTE